MVVDLPLALVSEAVRPAFERALLIGCGMESTLELRILSEISEALQLMALGHKYFDQPPDNIADFLHFCRLGFSAEFCDAIAARINDFRQLTRDSDETSLADTFIREHSRRDWVRIIVERIVERYPRPSAAKREQPHVGVTTSAPSTYHHYHFGGLDGNGDTGTGPLEQIILQGSDLKTAWTNNPTTRSWRPPVQSFSPNEHGAPFVFHGTWATREMDISNLAHGRLGLMGKANHMAPWGVFHTSFHGIRSFLWALFTSSVAIATLDQSLVQSLKRNKFTVDNTEYRGVLIIMLCTCTPAPPLLTAETLDETSIAAFAGQCEHQHRLLIPDPGEKNRLWKEMRVLHHRNSNQWPDIIHAPELPETKRGLSEFKGAHDQGLLPATGPLWRSGHCTDAALADLGHRFIKAYAVTLEHEATQETAGAEVALEQ